MTTAIITAYIVGVIVSYLFSRWIYSEDWTIRKRTIYMIISVFSWLQIIALLFIALFLFIYESLNNNDKAKW